MSPANTMNIDWDNLPSVQKLMGHNSIETTMIYTHQTTDHLKQAVSKLKFETESKKDLARVI